MGLWNCTFEGKEMKEETLLPALHCTVGFCFWTPRQWRGGGSKRTRKPISIITQKRDSLQIPFRSIDFIRKYPFVFNEFLPNGIRVLPHFLLTGEALNLDAEQCLVYQSDTYKKQTTDRLFWSSWWYQKPTKSHLASLIAWNGIWVFLIII